MRPITVGIAGGSGSGKSTLAKSLCEELESDQSVLLEQDSYYSASADGECPEHRNYDHPAAIDEELLASHLQSLRSGASINSPSYDFSSHCRSRETRLIHPRPCIIVEGILILASELIRRELDLCVFVDADAETRLQRRLRRDVMERGRTKASVREQWHATVLPMNEQWVEPSKRHAHLIIPDHAVESVGRAVLMAYLRERLADRR